MTDRIRFHLNEHVALAVAVALRKYGIDVTTTQEADLIGADDSTQLEYAHQEGRVIITHDADYLRWHSQGIETLRLMYELLSPEEMAGRVEFL